MTPYLTIPFVLRKETLKWAEKKIEPIAEHFQQNAPLDSGMVEFPEEEMTDWFESDIYKETLEYLKLLGIDEKPFIQFFIYKKLDKELPPPWMGNPHIDTYRGVDRVATFRLNILIAGDDDMEMVWWKIFDMENDPRLVVKLFPKPLVPGVQSKRIQVAGETKEERWATAGTPDWTKKYLAKHNTYASFVRTDYLHALNWNGKKPRIILSLRFTETPWEKIEEIRSQFLELLPQLQALRDRSS